MYLPLLAGIRLRVKIASIWGVKPPANRAFAKQLPTSGLDLDDVQLRCVVQPEELADTMTRQQGERNLDSGWTTLVGYDA